MSRPNQVPAYRNPPIDELAIGVQFSPIPNFLDAHAGVFWQKVRQDYPRLETQPRLEGPIESSGPPSLPLQIQFDVRQSRTWLINQADDHLIQIQNTRFIYNWRRREDPYPHFSQMLNLFQSNFGLFCSLLDDEGLDRPTVQQVELTYINWITNMPAQAFLLPAGGTTISTLKGDREPEQVGWRARYSIEDGGAQGIVQRLYVECQPAIRAKEPKEQGIQFAVVVKAAHADGLSSEQVTSLLEEGRLIAAQAFTDLTTEEAHKVWERYK